MSGLFSDLDEEFSLSIKPKKGGNLGDLFGNSAPASPQRNDDLSPQISKQTSPQRKVESSPVVEQPKVNNTPTIVYAIAGIICHKYDYSKNAYDLIGKIGTAILGVVHLNSYQILLYRSKEDHVARIPISSNFSIKIQNDVFASFIDTNNQNWSIKFPSIESISLFSMHFAIAKQSMNKSSLIIQDIIEGTGNSVDDTDNIKISYSAYLVTNGKVGKMFDSNLASDKDLRIEIGSEKSKAIKGLHEGIKGMKKSGKRIIVIPSHLGYGEQGISGRVPSNSILVYQVTLTALKIKDNSSVEISDVNENDDKRSQVLNRVKKIGVAAMSMEDISSKKDELKHKEEDVIEQKSVVHQVNESSPSSSTSSTENTQNNNMNNNNQSNTSSESVSSNPSSTEQQLAILQSQFQALLQLQMQQANTQNIIKPTEEQKKEPIEQQETTIETVNEDENKEIKQEEIFDDLVPYSNADNTKFLHDTRMIHEEIKSSVVSATNKIETLQRNIKNSIFGRDDEISKEKMSGSILIQTITQYVEQNEQLQKEVIEKGERIDELREKTATILEKNKKLIEEHTNTMEERNNALSENTEQTRRLINALRDEKLSLEEELNKTTEELSKIKTNNSKINHSNLDLMERYSEMKNEIINLKSESNLIKTAKLNDDSESNEIKIALKDEQAERQRLEEELEGLLSRLDESKEKLKKFRDGMEERKNKWIQIKTQMDKQYEDEKLIAMRQMKAQLLKLKKEKDEAIEEAQTIEHNIEKRWRENISRLKIQFKERVDELKQDLNEDKERELKQVINDTQNNAKIKLKQQKKQIEEQYNKGFKAARLEQLSSESSSIINNREKQLEDSFHYRKSFMTSTIKKMMSNIFYNLQEDIDLNDEYKGGALLVTLMDSVKHSTLDAIENINQHYSSSSLISSQNEQIHSDDDIIDDNDNIEQSDEIINSEELIEDEDIIEDDDIIDDTNDNQSKEIINSSSYMEENEENDEDDEFSELLSTTKVKSVENFDDLLNSDDLEDSDNNNISENNDIIDDTFDDDPDIEDNLNNTNNTAEIKEQMVILEPSNEPSDDNIVNEEYHKEEEHEKEHQEKNNNEQDKDKDESSKDDSNDENIHQEVIEDNNTSHEEHSEDNNEQKDEINENEKEEIKEDEKKEDNIDEKVPKDLPDTTFSSNPFGNQSSQKKTIKVDDIFGNKASPSKKVNLSDADDIFGGESTKPKPKNTSTDVDDIFGDSPKKTTPAKKNTSNIDDIFDNSSNKSSPKTTKQSDDLFSVDITKSSGKSDIFGATKEKKGLDSIFGNTSNTKKTTTKPNLDDIFNF